MQKNFLRIHLEHCRLMKISEEKTITSKGGSLMAYRLKDYIYNDKLTKDQNVLMDRLYKLRMSGMAEAFEKQILEPNNGLEPFEVRFAAIVNQEWDQRESKKFNRLMKKATLKYPSADLDSFIYDPERQLSTHVIELLSKCDWIDEPNNLLMTGGAEPERHI